MSSVWGNVELQNCLFLTTFLYSILPFDLHNSNLCIILQGLWHKRYIIIFYFINIICIYYLTQYLVELLNYNNFVVDV